MEQIYKERELIHFGRMLSFAASNPSTLSTVIQDVEQSCQSIEALTPMLSAYKRLASQSINTLQS